MDRFTALRTQWFEVAFRADAELRGRRLIPEDIPIVGTDMWHALAEETASELWRVLPHNEESVDIDSEWLRTWFVIKLLKSARVATRHSVLGSSARDKLSFSYDVASYVLYQIHCLRFPRGLGRRPLFSDVPDPWEWSVLKAEARLLNDFAVDEVGLPLDLDITGRLLHIIGGELVLYGTGESYRDHMSHTIDVCLLGFLLLDSVVSTESTVEEDAPTLADILSGLLPPESPLEPKKILANWFLASIFHDVARCVQAIDRFIPALAESVPSLELEKPAKALGVAMEEHLTSLGFSGSDKVDHGLLGAFELEQCLRQHGVPLAEYLPAREAIASHVSPAKHIELRAEPVSFLLFLVDRLQEWGRPRLESKQLAVDIATIMKYESVAPIEPSRSAKQLSIKARSNDVRQSLTLNLEELRFLVRYLPAERGVLEPAVTWLALVHDFYNLRMNDSPLILRVTLSHPLSQALRNLPWKATELLLLQEFVERWEETELSLFREFAQQVRLVASCAASLQHALSEGRTSSPVTYRVNDERGMETEEVTIDLRGLAANEIVHGLPADAYSVYHAWKWAYIAHLRSEYYGGQT